jgi:hypothetical protein
MQCQRRWRRGNSPSFFLQRTGPGILCNSVVASLALIYLAWGVGHANPTDQRCQVDEGIFCIYIFYPSSLKNNLILPIRPHPPMSVTPALMRFLQASPSPSISTIDKHIPI